MLSAFIAIVLMVFYCGAAVADRRVALVMGADDYRTIRPLKNAVSDAQAIEKTLKRLGFEVTVDTNRDLKRMRRSLRDFKEDGAGADVVLVFFAGHGVEISGENVLLPVDADASSLAALSASSLPLEDITEAVRAIAPVALVLLDACRNDPFGTGDGSGRGAVSITAAQDSTVTPGLGRVGRAENVLFAFAAAPGMTAADGTGSNSPFTAALIEHLGAEGVQVGSALKLVQQEVYDLSRGRQLPFIEDGLPAMFFAGVRGELPERERLLLAMAELSLDMRDEVERIAVTRDMPLAPLYAALIGSNLGSLTVDDRAGKLVEAAQAYAGTQEKLRTLESNDPEVTRLRAEAENSLALGALAEASAHLDEAISADRKARTALGEVFVSRTVSEAASLIAKAGVARTALDLVGAIAALEEAASLHDRIEALEVPDAARSARTWLLADLGDLHLLNGDTDKALDACERMLGAAEMRSARAPAEPDAQRDLSVPFTRIGDVQFAQGNLVAALRSFRDGLAIRERLAVDNPGYVEWQSDISISFDRIGDVLAAQGDITAALRSYRDGLAVRERLAAADPDNTELQHMLSVSFSKLGYMREVQGDLNAALASYRDGLAVVERLVAADAGNPEWQRALATALIQLGDVELAQGDLKAALQSHSSGFAIYTRQAEADPGNAQSQRELAFGFNRIGGVLAAQGNPTAALKSYRDGLAIRQRLTARDPRNADWQHDLSVSFQRIGAMQRWQGDLAGALQSYSDGLAILERLAAGDPRNAEWLGEVSLLLQSIGDVHRSQNDLSLALKNYRDSLAIHERLVASDPTNALWRRDLAVILQRFGLAHEARGDVAAALKSHGDALVVTERLAAADPSNAELQRDLVVHHYNIARTGGDARLHLNTALDIALAMQLNGTLAPRNDNLPGLLRAELAKLKVAAE